MGFLSYSLGFYRDELQRFENTTVTSAGLYRARRLLRMLDDLADEGYTELNEELEGAFSGVSRLREYLKRNNTEPFPPPPKWADAGELSYSEQDMELRCAISQTMRDASAMPLAEPLPFADKLRRFCEWVGYDGKTAYVFLLRDTLLPFVRYSAQGRGCVYPWLLSRSSFAALTGRENADDEIRAPIYRALEAGCTEWRSFLRFVMPDIRKTIAGYPRAKDVLCSMLEGVDAERILVVESGCTGTFSLLLMSLDDRVDMRMYTTYPYLTDVFAERIFTSGYEENRLFETMASLELYFRFSGVRNGKFFMRKCTDAAVEARALAEIRMMQPARTERPGI